MLTRGRRRLTMAASALAAAAALLASRPAAAQCFPDGLDAVPCCTLASVTIPPLPAISQGAKFVCFRDCAVQLDQNLCVTIAAPRAARIAGAAVCSVYTINFSVRTCGGTMPVLWSGTMRAQYVRNWLEINTTGATIGVWRFLLNGDFRASANLLSNAAWGSPNVQPGCYSTFNAIYVAGYVDYSFDCVNGTWSAAWALNHDCDSIHHPAGSPRAGGAFHPTRSWTFLGPSAGFVVDPVGALPAVGGVSNESFRWNDWSAVPNICRGEEPSAGGFVNSVGSFCPCTLTPPGGPQYDNTFVSHAGSCGSHFQSLPAPAPHLLQKRIGRWTNPAVFPKQRELCLAMGDADYINGCTTLNSLEYFEGVATTGGDTAFSFSGNQLGTVALDLGSANRAPNDMSRRVGAPHITQFVTSLHLP